MSLGARQCNTTPDTCVFRSKSTAEEIPWPSSPDVQKVSSSSYQSQYESGQLHPLSTSTPRLHAAREPRWTDESRTARTRTRSDGGSHFSSVLHDDDVIDRVRGRLETEKKRATLSPPPIPDNLCELKQIVSEIFYATENSQYVTPQVKDALRDCMHNLEAECNELTKLTHLGHRAAEYSKKALYLRMQFFNVLERRIEELSQLRSNFAESRDAFKAQPTRLLLEGIHGSKQSFFGPSSFIAHFS